MKDMEKLYRTIAPKLTNWLVSSGSQYEEACDIVQSTFLKIWKMRDDVRDDADSVSGLAFTIARNLRKNLARDKSHLTFVGEIRDSDEGVVGDAETSPIGTTERLDMTRRRRPSAQRSVSTPCRSIARLRSPIRNTFASAFWRHLRSFRPSFVTHIRCSK